MPAEGATSDGAGSWLRRKREASGLTQEELAARSGLSVRAISDLERGRTRHPYPRTIRMLADALRIPDAAALLGRNAESGSAVSPSGDGHGAPAVPRQLPPAVRHFAGRERELGVLSALLEEAGQAGGAVVVSAIRGTAGIGKTALAVYWAHRAADRFPDGQLYLNLRGFDPTGTIMTPEEAVRRFLDALDVPARRIPADLDAQAALYRTIVAGRRMLIVLDNARDADQIRPLLPGATGCLVVVTSRNQLTPLIATEDAHPITLDLLTTDEARDLLTQRLGADRVSTEPEAATTIIDRCARLPLALAIVAARAATHPSRSLAALADELADAGTGLDALSAGDSTTDMRTVFSWSYRALTADAARLFRLLGLHPGPDIATPAAASLAGIAPDHVKPLLAELTRANLSTEHSPGRYTLHDLLRAYARDLAYTRESAVLRHAATERVLDHYLHTAHTADRLLYPARALIRLIPSRPGVTPEHPTDQRQALAWFTAEHAVLLAAVNHASTGGFDAHTWQLAWTLATFLDRGGQWGELAETARAAVTAARRLADPTAQAHAHTTLASAYARLGHFDDADTHLRHALDRYRRAGDLAAQAHTHHNLGMLRDQRGRPAQALHHARQALDLFRAAGDQVGQANALNAVGWSHAQLGEFEQSLAHCQQALTLLQQLDDLVGQAHTCDSLGYANRHLGHHTQAITCYQHAVDLYRDIGDRYGEANTLTRLGDTHQDAGNPDAARGAWRQALSILDHIHHPNADTVRAKLDPAR